MTRTLSLLALALLLLAAGPAGATVMRAVPLSELVRGADAIVHGTVERTGTRGAVRGNRRPLSVARIRVHEWLAGEREAATVIVGDPGARTGGHAVVLHGAPHYKEGDEVVVFLAHSGRHYRTHALSQGVFFVEREPGAPARVRRELDELAFASVDAGGSLQVTAAEDELPAALPSLLATLRALAEYRP